MKCCGSHDENNKQAQNSKHDYLFWSTLSIIIFGYALFLFSPELGIQSLNVFIASVFEIINKMWWGILAGIFFVGLLELIPKKAIDKTIGEKGSIVGVVRAAIAGILFDLCSHGILLVAMKLYRRGVSLGQIMAFLIASPWNSISLTVILVALIGLKWTVLFIVLSFIIAVISGVIFMQLEKYKILPQNPYKEAISQDLNGQSESLALEDKRSFKFWLKLMLKSFQESKVTLKWVFLGVVIAASIRAFVPDEMFMHYFGPSMFGAISTLIATTIIEVCSEGSVPIAADILHRAMAVGNAFVFLMAGVATDYTEIMAIKDTSKSWKVALFLPLITIPQILIIGYFLNML